MDQLKSNLDWALEYARRWKIFPVFYVRKDGICSCRKAKCSRIGKHPTTRNGVQDATSDESVVRAWWTENPHANIGLACGHNGLIVVDVDAGLDKKTGKPKVGTESMQMLVAANTLLPPTLTAKTGGGGQHLYFFSTHEIKNSQDVVGKHIDVRGHGGYVILSPSNHTSGNRYEWESAIDAQIADMPEWLEKLAMRGLEIDPTQDIDEKQNAEIDKSLREDRVNPDSLIRLLYMRDKEGVRFVPPDCDRQVWWQIGAALKHDLGDKRGWEVWEAWSQEYSHPERGWDPKTASVQWASFDVDRKGKDGKPITGKTILYFAKQNGFRGFDIEAADAPEIVDNHLWIDSIKRIVEIPRLVERDKEQFNVWFAPHFPQVRKPADYVLKNARFRRVDSATYWPKEAQFVREINGNECLNYWRPSSVTPVPGPVDLFLEHVRYLFPSGEEADILLDYLAFNVRFPGEKIHWAVLLEGDQGNGKSYFATVMRLVLGDHNVKTITSKTLHETFTGWQRNCSLIVVEEMMAKERLELMNTLKPMITEPWAEIREMYKPPYSQPNRFNFLFFSNHNNALLLDKTDRRYCILKTEAPPHPDSNGYYAPLFAWTRENGPALAYYLGNRPLDNFKAKAHAPMTAGKKAMVRQSMTPLKQFIDQHVEAREYPLQWDLVTTSALVKPLKDFGLTTNTKEIANAFKDLGYLDLGRTRVGNDKVYMWAVREPETYDAFSTSQLRQLWTAQVRGTPVDAAETVDALFKERPRNPIQDPTM